MLVSDTVLEIKVRAALRTHPDLDEAGIRVHVRDAVVTLEGTVPEERLKYRAEEIAEAVFGVDEVDNSLRVA